jgi:TM2 domain-containing membrane protein YozV
MPDKVWTIGESETKQSPEEPSFDGSEPILDGKNPGIAASLSLLIWGGGQFYNHQRKLGLLYVLLMFNFYLVLIQVIFSWTAVTANFKAIHISLSDLLLVVGTFYASGVIFWGFNILQAYHKADNTCSSPFQGIKNPFPVIFCSLLVPGWGQLLNGQFKKGLTLFIFSITGFMTLPIILLFPFFWPALETPADRIFWENILLMALMALPFLFSVWIFAVHDALRVYLDPLKKEPVKKQVEYAINRFRMNGLSRELFKRRKMKMVLVIPLVLLLAAVYYYHTAESYLPILKSLRSSFSEQGMLILPEKIDQILGWISHQN